MSSINWTTIENAIQAWIVAGSGYASDHVIWSQQTAPRPTGAFISMRLIVEQQAGMDWLDRTDNVVTFGPLSVSAVTPASDTLTITGHGRTTGTGPVTLASSGTVPGGTTAGTSYWLVVVDANTVKLASTFQNAVAGVPTVVDITSAGTGTITLSSTSTTTVPGQEITQSLRGPRRGTLELQAFAGAPTGAAPTGPTSPSAVLHDAIMAYRLESRAAALTAAGIGVARVDPIRSTDGVVNTVRFEPRAIATVHLHLAAEVSENSTFIQIVNVTNQMVTTTPTVSTSIAMWGDSLTQGTSYGATTSYQTVPSRLAAKSPLRTVYNMGVAGETSTQIRSRLVADTAKLSLPTIIWAGHNNVNSPSTVLDDIAAMVAALGHTNYLVLSLINGDSDSTWWSGGSTYNNLIAINTALASTYGSHYVDVRSMLVAAYNPGYAQDVIDHGHDIVPVTLRFDSIHLTNKGYQLVASKIWDNFATLFGSAVVGGITLDATASRYAPSDASEWSLAMSSAGITSGTPDSAWLCCELSSANLTDFVAFTTLNANSTPTGNNAVSGWTRASVNTTEGASMMGFSSSSTVNLATTSALMLAYVQFTGSAAADREVMGLGSGFDHRYVALTSAGKIKATGLAGASATGTATPGSTVHPVVIKVDRSRSSYTVYTDQEKLSPAWTAPTGGGNLVCLGDQITGGAPPAAFLYAALWTGTRAELSDAQVRTLLQTLGWTVAW